MVHVHVWQGQGHASKSSVNVTKCLYHHQILLSMYKKFDADGIANF